MKLHLWLLFAFFLIAHIGGEASSSGGSDRLSGHVRSCGMTCCKLVDGTEACGCVESPASAPAGCQPMQAAPSASRVPQPSMTATLPVFVCPPHDPVEVSARMHPSWAPGQGLSAIGLPVLFCSFLI